MFTLISGGSGSGKSAYAEDLACSLIGKRHLYIATMMRFGKEDDERIKRHRTMRAEKQFITIEKPYDLPSIKVEPEDVVLLECLSNLLANESFFVPTKALCDARQFSVVSHTLLNQLLELQKQCAHLVLVTNEVFSDGIEYPFETICYQNELGFLNTALTKECDQLIEVVCGIPVVWKQFTSHN